MSAPEITTRCYDCGAGAILIREWFDVHDTVWELAWQGPHQRKPWQWARGQSVLCIGCLENRLGRTLCASDFTAALVNYPDKEGISERMYQRLTATESLPLDQPAPEKRKRGRPLGTKDKHKRRRPKGSKNKPK